MGQMLVACLIVQAALAFGADFTGKVVGVVDGDTLEVLHNAVLERIRLNGIDAPEKRQAFGQRATQWTSQLSAGRTVTIRPVGRDKYGRTIGDVVLPDGRVLNQELVRAGWAWWYCQYSVDRRLGELEAEARAAKRGLWADARPIAPWDYRHPNRPPAAPCRVTAAPSVGREVR